MLGERLAYDLFCRQSKEIQCPLVHSCDRPRRMQSHHQGKMMKGSQHITIWYNFNWLWFHVFTPSASVLDE